MSVFANIKHFLSGEDDEDYEEYGYEEEESSAPRSRGGEEERAGGGGPDVCRALILDTSTPARAATAQRWNNMMPS